MKSVLTIPMFPLVGVLLIFPLCLSAPNVTAAQEPVTAPIQQARQLLAKEKSGKAITLLQAQVDAEPTNALLHNELGAAFFQRNDLRNASLSFESSVKADPNLAHAWANLGEARRLSKKYRKAALAFHRFLSLRKGDRYGLYGLALSFEGYEAYDKALRTLGIAEREAQSDRPLLARINLSRRRIQEKIREADLPVLVRGDTRFVAGRYKAAAAIYAKGVKASPRDAVLRGRLGLTLAIMGDVKRGLPQLRAALNIDPNEAVSMYAYAQLSNPESTGDGLTVSDLLQSDRAALALVRVPTVPSVQRSEAHLRMGQLDNAYVSAPKKEAGAGARAEVHVLRGEQTEAEAQLKAAKLPSTPSNLLLWRRSLLGR